jgi:hypothetical protein
LAAPTFHQSGWISSQTTWKRVSHSISPIKSARETPSADIINTHLYASLGRFAVSSLKAQSTTPSATTAPPIVEPIVSVTNGGGGIGGGFLSAVSARKEREKGAQV